jgi:fructosamine-3-kinase
MRTDNERACEWLEANGHGAVEHCVACSGGDTCDSWELTLVSGARVFLKTHAAPPAGMFAAEAAGLTELRRSGTVRVPAVIHADPSFLLLEFIAPGVARTRARAGSATRWRACTAPRRRASAS